MVSIISDDAFTLSQAYLKIVFIRIFNINLCLFISPALYGELIQLGAGELPKDLLIKQ